MKSKFYNRKAIFLTLGLVVFLSFSFQSNFFEVAKQIEIYNSLFKELNMYYVDEINPAEITNKAITNTLKDLDPYTVFYNEQDVDDARVRREGEYAGIGVAVYYTEQGIEIKEIYKGFAADKAGLNVGDVIISVNNQTLEGLEPEELAMFLKGAKESTITIEIKRQNNILQKKVAREKVVVNPVPFYDMVTENIGYITLTRFNEKASAEVKKAFLDLKEKGMQKLVFDLRSNPGGSLLESINISNFFLPKNSPIVRTKGKIKEFSKTYRGTNNPLDLEIPIVVLINGRSASASEIVSGSLQDYDRAIILGERSFGKGLVQRQKPLTYGTQIKLTISKYYTPSGRCIQELDYTNRNDETGEVPKFSDSGKNPFKTANGRTVFDGGGITPDVNIGFSKKTDLTENLLDSKAIFNFATSFFYENPNLDIVDFEVNNALFEDFIDFLEEDNSFETKEETLFKEAYTKANNKDLEKEYVSIKEKLVKNKLKQISNNKDRIQIAIKDEIIQRYLYKEGLYKYNLDKDLFIKKAITVLSNQKEYNQILSVK